GFILRAMSMHARASSYRPRTTSAAPLLYHGASEPESPARSIARSNSSIAPLKFRPTARSWARATDRETRPSTHRRRTVRIPETPTATPIEAHVPIAIAGVPAGAPTAIAAAAATKAGRAASHGAVAEGVRRNGAPPATASATPRTRRAP